MIDSNTSSIFIIGSGRSGTHLACRLLIEYDEIDDAGFNGNENFKILSKIVESSIMHETLPQSAISYYDKTIPKINKRDKIFVDQCHSNLFHVDQIRNLYPNAVFLMMTRNPLAIISSYNSSKGKFNRWQDWAKDKKIPLPNNFLGISNKKELELPLFDSICKRVHLMKNYMEKVYQKHKDVIIKINFDDIVSNPNTFLDNFSNIKRNKLSKITIHPEFTNKYKDKLSEIEIHRAYEIQQLIMEKL